MWKLNFLESSKRICFPTYIFMVLLCTRTTIKYISNIFTNIIYPIRELYLPNQTYLHFLIYRVTHKVLDFRDYFTEFVQSVFLHSGFFAGQNGLFSVLINLVNHQNTQLNAETKSQVLNHFIFYSFGSSLHSLPLWETL